MSSVIQAFEVLSRKQTEIKIIFPMHPRTVSKLRMMGLYKRLKDCVNVLVIEPQGYIDFIKLMSNAQKVITDSGGIQKESYLLKVPCITIRNNTEWVETLSDGWNILTGTDTNKIVKAIVDRTFEQDYRLTIKPIFGSGNTSKIIKDALLSIVQNQ